LQGFQYKNQLILEQMNKKTELDNIYYNRYQDVLQQINTENALAEDIRQFNENQKWQTEQNALDRQQQEKLAELQRQFDAKEAELDRKHAKELQAASDAAAKERLAIQHQNEMKQLQQELANDKAKLKYEYDLAKQSITTSTRTVSAPSRDYNRDGAVNGKDNNIAKRVSGSSYAVNTAYYQGSKNADASKYGTFSNGYQPKGISGHGTLSKVKGDSITLKTQTLSGQKQTVVQNVWKAQDGTKWYWEGRQNKYIQIK
jgi:hypothetical protein